MRKNALLAAGTFGSQEEDLDILVIFKRADSAQLAELYADLKAIVPAAWIFPTFRLELLFEQRARTKTTKVHLLAYPSANHFCSGERGFVRYCIARSFVPWQGRRELLIKLAGKRPAADLNFYENLLCETMQLFLMNSLPQKLRVAEARKKLMYILKFSCLEVFDKKEGLIDFRHVADTVFSAVPGEMGNRVTLLYHTASRWNRPRRGDVIDAFHQTFALLDELGKIADCND